MTETEAEDMTEKETETDVEGTVPAFVQIITAAAHAIGRGDGDALSTDVLYGLDKEGRVWQWVLCDEEREGARDGWERLPANTYLDGKDPPEERRTR